MNDTLVLPNRKCGQPSPGLYAVGKLSPLGTLLPFTALVAPFPCDHPSPRAPYPVDTMSTLEEKFLLPPAGNPRYKGLPSTALADQWGKGAGYRSVADVIEETREKGICRRIARIPDVALPCPVLMMHGDAVLAPTSQEGLDREIKKWMRAHDYAEWYSTNLAEQHWLSRPWEKEAFLGHEGDPSFVGHPYVSLYMYIRALKEKRQHKKFLAHFGLVEESGVFGLTWITCFARVLGLGETEDDMSQAEIEAGVIPAYTENDPRAQEA